MKRVLVCEDDLGIRGLLHQLVRRRGYAVDVAVDGLDCLDKINLSDYDAILLDLAMPKLNGYEVLQKLRHSKLEILKRTIVITASTRAFSDPPTDVAGFFSKPFDVPALLAAIESVLKPE